MSKKVIVFIADGTEETEAIASIDILRRAGAEVTVASVMDNTEIQGSNDIRIVADCLAADADYDNADMLVLPGGMPGTRFIGQNEIVQIQCRQFIRHEKHVAAICAAPQVLGSLGLLDGVNATCYPGCQDGLGDAVYTAAPVEVDGNIITANGPGAALNFGLTLVAELYGSDKAEQVKSDMQAV